MMLRTQETLDGEIIVDSFAMAQCCGDHRLVAAVSFDFFDEG